MVYYGAKWCEEKQNGLHTTAVCSLTTFTSAYLVSQAFLILLRNVRSGVLLMCVIEREGGTSWHASEAAICFSVTWVQSRK